MSHQFFATLSVEIDMSDKDFNILLQCASNHYDFTVQSGAAVGGFLYGLKNRRDFSNGEYKKIEVSTRQIGLILKSLEGNGTDEARYIGENLYRIAMELHSTASEINNSLQKKV